MVMTLTPPITVPKRIRGNDGESTVLERAVSGDRGALAKVIREHAPAIQRLCVHVAGRNDARDAAQEALLRVVRRIGEFDARRGSFRAWALTVARRVCIDRRRTRGRERKLFSEQPEGLQPVAGGGDPERRALAHEQLSALERAVETLPERQRVALLLFHVQGFRYEEIAAVLEAPLGSVMTWLHRGRQRVRACMQEEEGQ